LIKTKISKILSPQGYDKPKSILKGPDQNDGV
jgi:hypothetical protein